MTSILMSNWFLSHASSSKECSLTFITSKATKDMESFTHLKTSTSTMRASQSNWGIQFRHLLYPNQRFSAVNTVSLLILYRCITLWTKILRLLTDRLYSFFWLSFYTSNTQPYEKANANKYTCSFANGKPIHCLPLLENLYAIVSRLDNLSISMTIYDRIGVCGVLMKGLRGYLSCGNRFYQPLLAFKRFLLSLLSLLAGLLVSGLNTCGTYATTLLHLNSHLLIYVKVYIAYIIGMESNGGRYCWRLL